MKNHFKKASKTEINYLLSYVEQLHLKPGEILFEENDENTGTYLIVTGNVREYSSWIDQELTIGNIVGVQHLLPGLDKYNTSTAETLTVVTALHLPKDMLNFECFEEDIYKEAAEEYIILNKDKFGVVNSINDHIIFIVGKSFIKRVYLGSMISLRRGGFVMKGRIRSDKGCFSLLRPTKKKIESIDDAILLIFPHQFSRILKNNRNLSDAFAEYYIKNAKKKQKAKDFFALKSNTQKRQTKIFKKLMSFTKLKMNYNSLDKMLEF